MADYDCSSVGGGGTDVFGGAAHQFDVDTASDVGGGGTEIFGGLHQFDVPACCDSTAGLKGLTWYFNMRGLNGTGDTVYWVSKDVPGLPSFPVTEVVCLLEYTN